MLRKCLKNGVFLLIVMKLFGCAQISNTYNVTGNENVIRTHESVVTDKKIDDMIRLNGSGYGSVQGGVER